MAKKMGFTWQKPCHTDVLTTAQKYKRVLFCRKLLRMTKENLLRLISVWMFTDEKWFDIVGPSPGRWVRAATKSGCKMENQVIYLCEKLILFDFPFCNFFNICLLIDSLIVLLVCRWRETNRRRAALKNVFTHGAE